MAKGFIVDERPHISLFHAYAWFLFMMLPIWVNTLYSSRVKVNDDISLLPLCLYLTLSLLAIYRFLSYPHYLYVEFNHKTGNTPHKTAIKFSAMPITNANNSKVLSISGMNDLDVYSSKQAKLPNTKFKFPLRSWWWKLTVINWNQEFALPTFN